MSLNLRKKRRGMTSLMETISCMVLFAMLLMMLLSIMSYANSWTLKEQQTFIRRTNTDLLIEELQSDVKSSEMLSCTTNSLEILLYEGDMVQYQFVDDAIYRNSELILSGINTGTFVEVDGESVGVYLRLQDGDIIETTIHR